MEKKDLRVRRTRALIGKALVELMREKSYNDITIKEIAERALVNRNTFYRHFRDKDDLLKAVCAKRLEWWRQKIWIPQGGDKQQYAWSMTVDTLQETSQNHGFYRTMMACEGTTYFMDQLKGLLMARMLEILGNNEPDYQTLFCTEYIVTGLLGAARFALEQNQNQGFDVDQTAQIVSRLMFSNTSDVLGEQTTK